MMQIRPVSDLRNKFPEIEKIVNSSEKPVFLTKNGYGSMVLMSLEMYDSLVNNIEARLDEADSQAEETTKRFSHEEVFSEIRKGLKKSR